MADQIIEIDGRRLSPPFLQHMRALRSVSGADRQGVHGGGLRGRDLLQGGQGKEGGLNVTRYLPYKPLSLGIGRDGGIDEGGLAALEGFKDRLDFRSGVESVILAVSGLLASGAFAGSAPAVLFDFVHIKRNSYLCNTLQRGEAFASPLGQTPISKEILIFQILNVILSPIFKSFGGFFLLTYRLFDYSFAVVLNGNTNIGIYFEIKKYFQDNAHYFRTFFCLPVSGWATFCNFQNNLYLCPCRITITVWVTRHILDPVRAGWTGNRQYPGIVILQRTGSFFICSLLCRIRTKAPASYCHLSSSRALRTWTLPSLTPSSWSTRPQTRSSACAMCLTPSSTSDSSATTSRSRLSAVTSPLSSTGSSTSPAISQSLPYRRAAV